MKILFLIKMQIHVTRDSNYLHERPLLNSVETNRRKQLNLFIIV